MVVAGLVEPGAVKWGTDAERQRPRSSSFFPFCRATVDRATPATDPVEAFLRAGRGGEFRLSEKRGRSFAIMR